MDDQVSNFAVHQPQLWAINIMNGTDMTFNNIEVRVDDSAAPEGENWAQNTDGFDTMDATNTTLTNFTFTGGDDCIALKPRSYNIHISNITCNGGNGIAIGSLGQYLEDSSVENVVIENVHVPRTRFGTYIKTWMGHLVPQDHYESGGIPRGGGWGSVRNITFRNVDVNTAERGLLITQDNGDNGSFAGLSKMGVEDVLFRGYTGTLSSNRDKVYVDCSEVHPCFVIRFEDLEIFSSEGKKSGGVCRWTAEGVLLGWRDVSDCIWAIKAFNKS